MQTETTTSAPLPLRSCPVMTTPQASAAFLLALQFGHGWAREIAGAEYLASIGGNAARWTKEGYDAFCASPALRRIVAARRSNLDYAYDAAVAASPDSDCGLPAAYGHTTQSETLSWDVAPDGATKITVRAGPGAKRIGDWNWQSIPKTVIAVVSVAPNGDTKWQHITTSPMKGHIAGRDGHHVNAADGQPLPGSDEYGYEVAARAVRAIGGRAEAQPQIRRLPRGRRGLAGIA